MKHLVLILLALIFSINTYAGSDDFDWKEGDIVFQISKSKQSKFIQLATHSVWSHCGIVVSKNNSLYVLEASNVVKLTPLSKWINRGRFKLVKTRRVFSTPVKIKYSHYLGQPYDMSFKFNNHKMYCSELVYEIYKNQFGVKLGKPKKVSEYHIFGFSKLLSKRGISKDQLVIAPCDIIN